MMDLPRSVILKTAAHEHPGHIFFECKCYRTGCQYCDGGLAACIICGGMEGSLTTECSGENLSWETLDQIYHSGLDFKDGKWQAKEES